MDTIMAEGLTRQFDSAEAAARDLVNTMRMHGWQGNPDKATRRLIAGQTLEHTRRTYRITEER